MTEIVCHSQTHPAFSRVHRDQCVLPNYGMHCNKFSPVGSLVRNTIVQQLIVLLCEDFKVFQSSLITWDWIPYHGAHPWRKWSLPFLAAIDWLWGLVKFPHPYRHVDWYVIIWVLFRQLYCWDFMGTAPMLSSSSGSLALTLFPLSKDSSFCQLSFILISLCSSTKQTQSV